MRITRLICIAATATATAVPLLAQDLPFGLAHDGHISLGYTDRTPGAEVFLFGDANLRLGLDGFGLPLGVELGLYGLATELDTPHETYGTLTWDLAQGGRVLAGVPRPAYDTFAVSALERDFPTLGIDRTAATRSVITDGAMFGGFLPYGIRFQNGANGLDYALSYHDASNVDTRAASLGLAYKTGDWTLSGAVEIAWAKTTEVSAKAQASGQIGQVTAGLGLYLPGATGAPDMAEAFAAFNPLDRLTVSGVIQMPLDGATDPTAGLAARYTVGSRVDVSLGVASDAGAAASLSAFVDFRF